MSVTKGTCGLYVVRNRCDSATICIHEWAPRKDANGMLYGGVILAYSTFGSYCNAWSACGVPFKQFLIGCNFDYFMTKCLGSDARVFDGEKSVRAMLDVVLSCRRYNGLAPHLARDAWDHIIEHRDEAEASEHDFVRVMQDCEVRCVRAEPWEHIRRSPTAQSTGFWRDIWPHFIAAIREESRTLPEEGVVR